MSEPNPFDKDYYENGQQKRISGYTNYGWMPERSFPEAASIIKELDFKIKDTTVLDFGCAKGYLVHALRQLGIKSYGEDISTYAIENCHPEVKTFVSLPKEESVFDWVLAKDVMEHIPEASIPEVLKTLYKRSTNGMLMVVPLGENGKFRIREYEIDVTHVTRRDEGWWTQQLIEAGFEDVKVSYNMGDVKKKWIGPYPYGNGFFVARK
jgi:2-polyprenyl-3-methyl-5-hydroxy-6-metoxy-1,4-benzoquinol methylase